jgi:hypothetical protein
MSAVIERPTFFYGQYLGHDDLELSLQYNRGQLARHERYLHTPGIAAGLDIILKPEVPDGKTTLELTLQPGVAVDAQGREIVVPEAVLIEPLLFRDANVFVKDSWHPLFLLWNEDQPPVSPFATGACDTGQAKRKLEGYALEFGRPGAQLDASGVAPSVSEGAEPETGSVTWPVLLGFVKWDDTKKAFVDFATAIEDGKPVYAGAQADEVVARSGVLTLRARGQANGGKGVVQIDERTGLQLIFGIQGEKDIKALLTVDEQGNVTAAGEIKSTVGLSVESGVVSDGMMLPLPANVKPEDVDAGKVQVHALLTPATPCLGARPAGANWAAMSLECRLDGLRVVCRGAWFRMGGNDAPVFLTGAANYLLITYAPSQATS